MLRLVSEWEFAIGKVHSNFQISFRSQQETEATLGMGKHTLVGLSYILVRLTLGNYYLNF